RLRGRDGWAGSGLQYAELGPLAERLQCARIKAGRDQHLEECLGHYSRRRRVQWPVQGDHAPKGRARVPSQRVPVGPVQVIPDCDPARVAVLDDGGGGPAEVRDQRQGGLGIQQVVVGELEALPLTCPSYAATLQCVVQRRGLVWILAIAQVADLVPAQGEVRR